jgi:uncharacterized phage protein gp47/JayE
MPFRRPTFSDLKSLAQATFGAKLPGADATLPKSNLNVLSEIIANAINGLYGYMDFLAANYIPGGWVGDILLRWCTLFGLSPNGATPASGKAVFTGIAGTNVVAGSTVQDGNGNLYTVVADTELGVGDTEVAVVAATGGAGGNLAPGAKLTLTSIISGVDGTALVGAAGFGGGLDPERQADLRARLIDRIQNPPGGAGTKADYERWPKDVAGVTRTKAVGAPDGAGTVAVRFVMDDRDDIIPTEDDLDAVLAVINAKQPLTDVAGTQVLAPVQVIVNYTLSSSAVPDYNRSLVTAALKALHRSLEIGAGLSIQTQVIPAIVNSGAVTGNPFLVSPTDDIAPDDTKVLTLGTIIYV